MLERLMQRLGWVRRAEYQKLLIQHMQILNEQEKLIRLAQLLLKQNAPQDRIDVSVPETAEKPQVEERVAKPKPAPKLH